jgi:hypothetical protein
MTETDTVRGPLWGRTPASQQRRRDILVAGKKVFFECGYPLASVDRIAEVAGTTKRTVYDHFGSKEALFAEDGGLIERAASYAPTTRRRRRGSCSMSPPTGGGCEVCWRCPTARRTRSAIARWMRSSHR